MLSYEQHAVAPNARCAAGRAQAIGVLLRDSERLKEERAAFAAKRRMYAGYSREDMATPARSASTGYDGIGSGGSGLRRSVSLSHVCSVGRPFSSFILGACAPLDLCSISPISRVQLLFVL